MSITPLYIFAFASGVAALIYQIAWSRILSMTFGSSTLAVSAVVAGFMGGMGIGAWLYHRVGDRDRRATRAYGLLEIGIALSTALFTTLYLQLPYFFAGVAEWIPTGGPMDAFRIAVAFVLLLIPSTLMGATYPALCKIMLHSADDVDRRLGWIYGLNTVGAAVGAVVAGFVLIELVGATWSVTVANAISLAIGAGALLLARRELVHNGASTEAEADEQIPSALPVWLTGLVLVGSGFTTLGYEIVWFRALHYILGPGAYVLSATLTVFLLGLGFGSFLYRPAIRLKRPEWALGFSQIAVASFALAAIAAEQYVLLDPYLFEQISYFGQLSLQSWQWRLAVASLSILAIMLPATLWMGVAFPLASRLFLRSTQRLTSRVGLAYLLSNVGSITGAILAAVWILPRFGTVDGIRLLAGLNVLLALFVFARLPGVALRLIGFAVALLPVVIAFLLAPRFDFYPQTVANAKAQFGLGFEEESDLGIVQVFNRRDVPNAMGMAINGTFVGNTRAWNPFLYSKQVLLADLPMLLDRNIKTTLNLGLATSSTLKTLSRYKSVEILDVVEINPAVVRGASLFFDSIVLDDPRVELFVEDALHYLLSTNRTYDLIINDAKQHMRFGGSSRVLSTELYQYASDRLSECGLFVQFVSTVHSTESFGLILRTIRSVYPELEIFFHPPGTVLMVGSRCPIAGRERLTRDELPRESVRTLEELFFSDATTIDSFWVADGNVIDATVGEGPLNSWDVLPLEFMSYRLPSGINDHVADSMEMILPPPPPSSPFTQAQHYGSMQKIDQAVLDWMRRDYKSARHKFAEVLADEPNHVMARRVAGALEVLRGVSMLDQEH